MTTEVGRVAEATGLSQAEPQSAQGLDPSGFDPSRIADGQWVLIPDYRGFAVKQVAKVTPKLVKFAGPQWPRQATLLTVVAALDSKADAERLKQSLEGALGTYHERERRAREDFNARKSAAKIAFERKKRELVETAIAMEAATAGETAGLDPKDDSND
jgi:hypothetical protein